MIKDTDDTGVGKESRFWQYLDVVHGGVMGSL